MDSRRLSDHSLDAVATANTISVTNLPDLVDRAARTLADARGHAEVLEAKMMASLAGDIAKKVGRTANNQAKLAEKSGRFEEAKRAHDELVAAAHRAQADAIAIEKQADVRLADEYDSAQERGEVQRHGGQGKRDVPEQNIPSVADIGLTRKDIHEARQVRDAEKIEPGLVRRVLDDTLAKGEEPSKAVVNREIAEKLGKLADAKRRAEEKLATKPTPAEALELSKQTGSWVRANDGESYIHVDPAETQKYDVWLEMKRHVMGLSDPAYSAQVFAENTPDFWIGKFPSHIDAAIAYLAEVKRHLEARHVPSEV